MSPKIKTKAAPMLDKFASISKWLPYIVIGANVLLAILILVLTVIPPRTSLASSAVNDNLPVVNQADAARSFLPIAFSQIVAEPQLAPETDFYPPVALQGGVCIQGTIIDVYEQRRGAGWVVTLTPDDPADSPVIAVAANSSGFFRIPTLVEDTLPAGTYTLELAVPAGWRPFTPNIFKVTLSGDPSQGCAQVRFKVEALACLIAHKQDTGGDPAIPQGIGIPGWEFTISEISTTPSTTPSSATTDWKGRSFFYNLPPGNYLVKETAQIGWCPASGENSDTSVSLISPREPGVCQEIVFTNRQEHNSCIAVRKQDTNGKPLPGWLFWLKRPDGTFPPRFGITGEDGTIYFTDLPLGEWEIIENYVNPFTQDEFLQLTGLLPTDLPGGWTAFSQTGWEWSIGTLPGELGISMTPPPSDVPGLEAFSSGWWVPVDSTNRIVNLEEPSCTCKLEIFTNEALGGVQGYKINHFEQGLSGWEINATNQSTGETKTTYTDSTGYFRFHLNLGTWIISEVIPDGWEAVTPSEVVVNITQPFVYEHVRFKNKTEYACVDVYKRDSFDGVGLPGWLITMQPAYGGTASTGWTDGTGWYRFNMLPPGTYIVSETMLPGWEAVTPPQTITIEATGVCSIVELYNRQTNNTP